MAAASLNAGKPEAPRTPRQAGAWSRVLGAVILAAALGLAAAAPKPMRLTAEDPVGLVRLPVSDAPKALALSVAPKGPLSIEAWLEGPGRPATRMGAVAPYPVGRAGEFLIAWPSGIPRLPPPARVRLVLKPGAPGAEATVSARWRR